MTDQVKPTTSVPDLPYLKFDEEVTLTNCDLEPIHIPAHAQAYGVIVVVDPSSIDLTILQVTDNVGEFCGVRPKQILGLCAEVLFGADQTAMLSSALSERALEANPVYLFTGPINNHGQFHVTTHTYHGLMIVELEPLEQTAEQKTGSSSGSDLRLLLRNAFTKFRSAATTTAYSRTVCEAIQEISGFDRVMVYKFHDDGHGEVIAEAIGSADSREPYLGLHYPASDIPRQARALFLLNTIRLMPDAHYEQAKIIPTLNPLTSQPLDMTHCVLRGYSQMYTEYLTNMGSRASMSLAIVSEEKLWGLVACHHLSYRLVPYDVRMACELLVDVVSLQIADKQAQDDIEYRERIHAVHKSLIESTKRHGSILIGLTDTAETEDGLSALSLIEAGGCAVLSENNCRLLGNTPTEHEVQAMVHWLRETRPEDEEVWSTDEFESVFPAALDWQNRAGGVLALRVSMTLPGRDWVLWFRPAAAQTVNWAGDPKKPYLKGPMGDRLTPRKSFELWQETALERSLPWVSAEIEGVRRLRRAIISQDVARKSMELTQINTELARSNTELDFFAYATSHDLKEPLRGISNYVRFLREDHGESLNSDAQLKLDTVMRLTRRMDTLLDSLLHYSQLGRQELVLVLVDLNQVLSDVMESLSSRFLHVGAEVRVPRPLPSQVLCDLVQISELFTNLVTNAVKYNEKPTGERWVEIGWLSEKEFPKISGKKRNSSDLRSIFFVRDNGIGIPKKQFDTVFRIFKRLHSRTEYGGGTGAGLTICKRIVERHQGKLWIDSAVGEGTTFYFTLGWEPSED
jgi:two-component system, chemotaxis family, sensor kinase Cph1